MKNFFALNKIPHIDISIAEERKQWLKEFLKVFIVIFVVYATMYLIRNNFKAAGPLLIKQMGFTTTQLGVIGVAFSFTYAIGKTLLGYVIDGRNAKRIISFLLVLASIVVAIMGIILLETGKYTAFLLILWGLNGFLQAPGGPGSYSTVSRWTPNKQRGRWLGIWNVSHNIGGAMAGVLALWGANVFFHGNVAGMFIVPAVIACAVGVIGMFVGKDDPEELGWDDAATIWGEPENEEDLEADKMSKGEIFKKFVLKNPMVWILAVANVFVYIVRIGIDNWVPVYSSQVLGFTDSQSVQTLFYFEMGAIVGSLSWGFISDWLNGRRMATALISVVLEFGAIYAYSVVHTPWALYATLAVLGWLVFGPQLLIGVSVIGFVPKAAASVTNGIVGTFAYLFGDSMAKVGLGLIADPSKQGINFLGMHLHGWAATFGVFYVALAIAMILMVIVAIAEERRIKNNQIEAS
ncbi:OPA family hexose phosphate transport protein UhpT-like MFS transporter [Weissella uvarum]|uniref:hexose-6-phosphate:phosphate antiporter n=1 Tax=Weissella uvarum TaxID=1479233 RepID=UPI0019613CD2|nr:hexose-6-phosphate:phosphate antiporter [Weissella uvarum]MBM7617192.1 OPA family hexose phosphate transport protein UhpT-like MFS transporter [Weissella uvarum]MCM0595486.1 hexose-6-phosphate:phosphate antiporter [Weissella uvarum]